ncbi:putative bifunctional diguanylate cyclase/phosphodiesterase [Zeimonas arvi]|nr:EAL domain-containing protein [Zeimonas arvi]
MVVVAAGLAAYFTVSAESPADRDLQLEVITALEEQPGLGPGEALNELTATKGGGTPRLRAGKLTGGTHWLMIDLEPADVSTRNQLKLESLRLQRGEFWLFASKTDGEWDLVAELPWNPIRDGVSIAIPKYTGISLKVLGRFSTDSFNRPSVRLVQDEATLNAGQFRFERQGGLLLGSLLMLAMFSLLIAAFNRDMVFLLFGAWLITSLRVAAQNGGWDLNWIGLELGNSAQRLVLRLSLVAHFVLSLGLFEALFRTELTKLGLRRYVWSVLLSVVIVTTLVSHFFPSQSLNVIWVFGFASIILITVSVAQIIRTHPNVIAYWYAIGWGITAAGLIGEIAYASGVTDEAPKLLNSQVSALASALVMAIALAARMNEERAARVTAQNRAVSALQRFRENYNTMPVGLFSMRDDGTILEYNPAFGVMFDLPPPSQYREPKSWAEVANQHALESLIRQADESRLTDTEIAISSREGGRRWLHMRALRKQGRIETWIEDVTARKEAEGRLQFLADHDSLTGLLNRRGFNGHLERAIAASRERSICFAYVDLDRFKLVNDLFGHVAGDQILRQMSTRTRSVIRPPHIAARVGGDEFVVVINDMSLETARALCEELRRALSERPYQHQDKAFSVAASIGVIQLAPEMTPRDALTASDRACAEAKKAGGSTVVALGSRSSELTTYLDEIKLVANMRERLPVENFFTQLQPIVSLRTPYASLSYEVLVRMRDGAGAVVPPGRFIAAAERNGLMSQIDRWVLRSTLEWLDENPDHRERLGFCTINLSGASLNDEKFLQDTIALIRNHPDATQRVCFEITESVALYDLKTTRRFVDRVKSFGARVALDDFGAGYTSFSYLKELPGDFVKIDGSFIRDVNLNPANHAITRAIVDLSHEIGMACVAEWAENAEIVRTLMDLNVDYAQGFGLCRPVDRERLLHAEHGMSLVQDTQVIEVLGHHAPPARRRNGITGRRSILSV